MIKKAVSNKQKHKRISKREVNRKAVDTTNVIRKEYTHTERKLQLEQLTRKVMGDMAQRRIKHKRDFAVFSATDVDGFPHDVYNSPPQRNQTEVTKLVLTL